MNKSILQINVVVFCLISGYYIGSNTVKSPVVTTETRKW